VDAGILAGCPAFSSLDDLDLRYCCTSEERWAELNATMVAFLARPGTASRNE